MNASTLNQTRKWVWTARQGGKAGVLCVDDSQNAINQVYLSTRHIMQRDGIPVLVNPVAPLKRALFPNGTCRDHRLIQVLLTVKICDSYCTWYVCVSVGVHESSFSTVT